MPQVPALIWAQRREKVFVTFECLATEDVSVTFSDGLLSIDAKAKDKVYKLENLPLFLEIEAEESKWFKNDRFAAAQPAAHWQRTGVWPQRAALAMARAGLLCCT
jgi:hypothetical protein